MANLNSLISDLPTDPFLSGFTPSLTAALNALTAASSASDIQTAVTNLGTALASLATTITDEAAHGFTLSLAPDRNVVQPDAPEVFDLVITNTGSVATTYDLSVSGLPSGVTSSFSEPSVTVQPGQTLDDELRGADADLDRVAGHAGRGQFHRLGHGRGGARDHAELARAAHTPPRVDPRGQYRSDTALHERGRHGRRLGQHPGHRE